MFKYNTYAMNNQFLNFYLSHHFMLRGWDRSIDKTLLYKVLPFVKCTECDKDVILVYPSFLKVRGIARDDRHVLVLIIKKNVIVTAYWCDHPNYLFNREKDAHFQTLY